MIRKTSSDGKLQRYFKLKYGRTVATNEYLKQMVFDSEGETNVGGLANLLYRNIFSLSKMSECDNNEISLDILFVGENEINKYWLIFQKLTCAMPKSKKCTKCLSREQILLFLGKYYFSA